MPPTYLIAPDAVCMNRAKNDADYHYSPYINSLQKLLEKKSSTKIRLELNRVKQWVKEYELWATNWHKNNYIRLSDCYSNPEEAHPSERVPPPVAPFFEVYSELNSQS